MSRNGSAAAAKPRRAPGRGKAAPLSEEEAQFRRAQLEGLQWTVRHAYEGSPFYRAWLDEAKVGPETVRTLDDLQRLPLTSASDLAEGYPLPLVAVPLDDIVRVHSSSGTTGRRKILAYTRRDLDDWTGYFARCLRMAEVGRGDRVHIAAGFGLWTAGAGFQAACEAVGAMAIPVGASNMDLQCQLLTDLQPTVICSTASGALLLAEEVGRRHLKDRLKVRTVIQGAERCSDAMRRRIQESLGAEHVHDIGGLTELYGAGTGMECRAHQGLHYWADAYILELLDPNTLRPVRDGEIGEMVVTTLRKEAVPLIRYRTRDLTRFLPEPCACGSPYPRHDRLVGRDDDMFMFRAVSIYPGQLEALLSGVEGVSSEYQVILERKFGKDTMRIQVERDPAADPRRDERIEAEIEYRVKARILVSAEVSVVDFGTLPRSERTARRVFDKR
ncbi:MAG: phenylacetate--CoA ligase [Deltaproteobacteria bacterium]|nr:phenylacetate--CoA ligase [Deltaproteobacteria bacterium]